METGPARGEGGPEATIVEKILLTHAYQEPKIGRSLASEDPTMQGASERVGGGVLWWPPQSCRQCCARCSPAAFDTQASSVSRRMLMSLGLLLPCHRKTQHVMSRWGGDRPWRKRLPPPSSSLYLSLALVPIVCESRTQVPRWQVNWPVGSRPVGDLLHTPEIMTRWAGKELHWRFGIQGIGSIEDHQRVRGGTTTRPTGGTQRLQHYR